MTIAQNSGILQVVLNVCGHGWISASGCISWGHCCVDYTNCAKMALLVLETRGSPTGELQEGYQNISWYMFISVLQINTSSQSSACGSDDRSARMISVYDWIEVVLCCENLISGEATVWLCEDEGRTYSRQIHYRRLSPLNEQKCQKWKRLITVNNNENVV